MTAQYLTIEQKHRQGAGFLASIADFTVAPGDAASPGVVRADPHISLYCLDDASKCAIFVELPPGVNLAAAPFVYRTQYEQAQRLLSVPYENFIQLARELPPVENLIMCYMTGRCGSTLLSHVLNELDTVLSLSEPDVATQFVHLRSAYAGRETQLRELLDSTVRVLFKPAPAKAPSVFALKLRSEGTQVMDLFQATFPGAKNLFLYRDAIGWVTSFYRLFSQDGTPRSMPREEFRSVFGLMFNYDFTRLDEYLEEGTTELSTVQMLALWWLATIEWYLAKQAQGIPILAVRYADLNARREQVLAALFSHCGLPPSKVPETLGAFARDSQAGTALARENPREGNKLRLSDAQRDEIVRILKRHPVISEPDFVVPGTLVV